MAPRLANKSNRLHAPLPDPKAYFSLFSRNGLKILHYCKERAYSEGGGGGGRGHLQAAEAVEVDEV